MDKLAAKVEEDAEEIPHGEVAIVDEVRISVKISRAVATEDADLEVDSEVVDVVVIFLVGGGVGRGHGTCYICDSPDHWSNRCPDRNRRRGGPRAARGGNRTVPSRTALHMAMGANASESVCGNSGATAAAETSRASEN